MAEYSKIIKVGDHIYERPQLVDKSEIWFIDEKPENAYWRRDTNYPDIWFDFIPYETKLDATATIYDQDNILITLSVEDSNTIRRLYEQEIRRRIYGVYFKNGNDIEYITGDHYMALQWCQMATIDNQPYPSYREFQRDYYYLVDKVNHSQHISGLFVSKPKKTGITNLHWIYYLNKATLIKDRNLAAENIDKGKAVSTFKEYFVYAFSRLPSPLKPNVKNFAPQDGVISFGERLNTNKKKKGSNETNELNCNVMCLPPDPHAADILKFHDVWLDEIPKLVKESPEEWLNVTSQAVKMGNYKNGNIWATSYTPDEDTDAFKEARKIFFDASATTINQHSKGKTKNSLIHWHIPSTCSWIGENNDCFDKYGKCDELKALQEIEYERNKVKDDKRKLQAITRQYAITAKEAWASAGAGSTFDNIRLGDILSDLQEDIRNQTDNEYTDGKLEWKRKEWEIGRKNKRQRGEFCEVEFVPLTNTQKERGDTERLRFYDYMPNIDKNIGLKFGRDNQNNVLPPKRFDYVGGIDPTEYAAEGEVIRGSKNASYTLIFPNETRDTFEGRVATNKIITQYFYRPENPSEFYEDMVKEIIYFGKLVIPEGNKKWLSTQLIEDGLGRFMLVRNKETGLIEQWKPGLDYTFIQTTAAAGSNEMKELFVRLIKTYIEAPVEGEKDFGRTIKSEELLQQLMDFTPTDTKLYDLVMAFAYTLLAKDQYMQLLLRPQNNNANDYRIAMRALSIGLTRK